MGKDLTRVKRKILDFGGWRKDYFGFWQYVRVGGRDRWYLCKKTIIVVSVL